MSGVPPAADRRRAGFTLIEVMIGLALLAVVVGLVQGVYSGALRSRDIIEARTEQSRAAALLLHRITDELASLIPASPDNSHDYLGLVLDQDSSQDAILKFDAYLPAVLQAEASSKDKSQESGGAAVVEYSVEQAPDGSRQIVRKEVRAGSDLNRSTSTRDEKGDVLMEGVSRFRVKYLLEGDEWHDPFGGSSSSSQSSEAKAVRIEVGWREGKKADAPERVLRTAIPLYPNLVKK